MRISYWSSDLCSSDLIDDEGLIKISSSDLTQIEAARNWIHGIVAEPEVGAVYTGKVVSMVDFGAFVNFMGARDGLVHISEIKNERVAQVSEVLTEGQEVKEIGRESWRARVCKNVEIALGEV